MPGHYHNKHEISLEAKDAEGIEEAGMNYQKLMAHQVNVALGIAGRGDTHALDGGRIPASETKRGKAFKKAMQTNKTKQPLIKSWQDRNLDNQGTKLNP
jgi:hypothetical protein